MPGNVVEILQLDESKARKVLEQVCAKPDGVIFTYHAEERMQSRGITRTQVMRCLRNGVCTEGPYKEPGGSWKFNLQTRTAGDDVTVVVVLDNQGNGNYAVIVTVIN